MASQPERIDRYEIKSPIGGGGMGTLYLAQDPNTGRLVALKLLHASLDSAELRARFKRESQALAALNHQNIVTIYDSGEYRGAPFMVMEYVRGETIAEKLARRADVPLEKKLKWLGELCAGLSHAHEAGVIHRDIKPANLMVDRQDRLKIVDFGIARVTESLARGDVQVTQMHVQIGTPGYMAPEQMRGTGIDHRCDLFAVGAVAYELLSGREAFEGRSTVEVQQKVLHGRAAPLHSVVPDLPADVVRTVHKALEPDPVARFPDAATLGTAFDRARVGLTAQVAPSAAALPAPSNAVGGTRADNAFRQAIEALEAGAPGEARRHALEALAEAPNHLGARTVLKEIDGRRSSANPRPLSPPAPAARPGPAAPRSEAVPTAVEAKTVIMKRADLPRLPTAPPPRSVDGPRPADEPKTVAVPARPAPRPAAPMPPVARPAPPPRPPEPSTLAGPSDATVIIRRPVEPKAPRPAARRVRLDWVSDLRALLPGPLTSRQKAAAGVVALGVAGSVAGVVIWEPWVTRHQVTLQPVEGGTLRAPGLECGADGADCSASVRAGTALAVEGQPDPGYVLVEYTGHCAPSGRMVVRGPVECGATFVRVGGAVNGLPAGSSGEEMLLTIAPPDRAQVVGQGIACGGGQKQCDAKFAPDTIVELRAIGISGAVVRGFTGDCSEAGRVVMDGPKLCSVQMLGDGPISTVGNGTQPPPPPSGPGPKGDPPSGPNTGPRGPARGPVTGPGTAGGGPPVPPGGGPGAGGVTAPAAVEVPTPSGNQGPGGNTPAGDPGKPVPPIATWELTARERIKEMLDKYLAAYNKLSYAELKTVYINAPPSIRSQLDAYRSMEYSFAGDPKFLSLEADERSGTATIELAYKQAVQAKIGAPQKTEGIVVFQAHRGANNDWVIDSAKPTPKKLP